MLAPVCGYANVVHTSSSFRPHPHPHTHTIWDGEPTELKVDIAAVLTALSINHNSYSLSSRHTRASYFAKWRIRT